MAAFWERPRLAGAWAGEGRIWLVAPFTEGPRPWLVLARNAIPAIGVYGLGWSTDVIVFQIWFDGVTALGAMLAFQVRGFASRGGTPFDVLPGVPPSARLPVLAVVWLLIWLLLGIPYWFTMLFLGTAVFKGGVSGATPSRNPGAATSG